MKGENLVAAKRYSVWLVPEGKAGRRLTEILCQLRRRHDGPAFSPHITLVGSFPGKREELIEKTCQVAVALKPLAIRLGRIDYSEAYFRDLFAHAGPRDSLRAAHQRACRILGPESDLHFMPHLSLLYGNHSRELKQQIATELGPQLRMKFTARRVCLFNTSLEVENWREVASFEVE